MILDTIGHTEEKVGHSHGVAENTRKLLYRERESATNTTKHLVLLYQGGPSHLLRLDYGTTYRNSQYIVAKAGPRARLDYGMQAS